MITIKSPREIELLKQAGNVVYQTHQYIKPFIKEGITTKELDRLCEEFIRSKGCTPSFKGCEGFPNSVCTSVNDCIVHGVPSNYKLKNGDIITIDIGACYKGYHGDSGWTYAVGNISDNDKYLMEHTEKALYEGIKKAVIGNRVGDIGHAVYEYATKHHLGVVREFVGHGVGTSVHEDPSVPNYGKEGTGPLLKEGMVIAIVCSKCAALLPSQVYAVNSLSSTSNSSEPNVNIGSIAITIPSLRSGPVPSLP